MTSFLSLHSGMLRGAEWGSLHLFVYSSSKYRALAVYQNTLLGTKRQGKRWSSHTTGGKQQISKICAFLGDGGEKMKQERGTESGMWGRCAMVRCWGVILDGAAKKMEVRR